MGLREKADFNLQAITLFVALLTVLFLCAARHYTSDWRERRVFRKHLVRTQTRLKHNNNNNNKEVPKDKRDGRRQWKRFVAALPFMPLATAYVCVRIGWDLFELLVFCTIDGTRETAISAVQSTQALTVFAYTQSTRILVGLDVKRRAQDALIAVIENTVVWLFNTAFPKIGMLGDRCAQQLRAFACWWAERGGPWLRDAIEHLVLNGIVPAYGWCSSALIAVYARTLWLGVRCVQAASILANDIARDVAIAYAWAASVVSWLTSLQRWWFTSRWMHFISYYVVASAERVEKICRMLMDGILPRCLSVIRQAYMHILLPFGRHISWYGDQVIQAVLGAGVHIYKGLLLSRPVLLEILDLLSRSILFRKWYGYSSDISRAVFFWMYDTTGTVSLWLQTNTVRTLAILWPLVCRGFDDGALAMRDVYRQLIVAMDAAVAMVGDLVVELARRNTVHNPAKPGAAHIKGD
ncbi:hypothetical protein IW140_005351 [Coemansia sp. RSA 1813]|nr:hypothetical protein IW140_005351 [Coemansia sp. RSA 1813]